VSGERKNKSKNFIRMSEQAKLLVSVGGQRKKKQNRSRKWHWMVELAK
jgi:hypothetical protein